MSRLDAEGPVPTPQLRADYAIREMTEADLPRIIAICEAVYPDESPYTPEQLEDHRQVFPEGQFVVEHVPIGTCVGIQATLVVRWDDYGDESTWDAFTANGTFLNHDPAKGHTLYGAEMMVDPAHQHHGLSRSLIEAARELTRQKSLARIRAGSRLAGFHLQPPSMTPAEYVQAVIDGRIGDPVLSVHLREGWTVFGIDPDYLPSDLESRGCAALIEWINPDGTPP